MDEREVEIPDVMEDRAATSLSSYYVNIMTINVFLIDLSNRILVPTNDNCVVVLPQHEDIVFGLL